MPPLPTIPHGQRRPIIDGHVPQTVERLGIVGGVQMVMVYVLAENRHGDQSFVFKGPRPLENKGALCASS